MLEVLRSAAWICVLTGLARAMGFRTTLLHLLHGLLAALLLVAPADARGCRAGLSPPPGSRDVLIPVGIGVALVGLILLEQVYRNSRAEMRDSMKLLAVALGVIFAYDLYVFAQAQLLHGDGAGLMGGARPGRPH